MLRPFALWVKRVLFRLVESPGVLLFLLSGKKPKAGLTILCYHRIADGLPRNPLLNSFNVSPAQFERQLAALESLPGISVVSVRQVAEWLETGPIPAGSFLLFTFDDGYKNAIVAAVQLAAKGLNGVFFVVTGYVGEEVLDFNVYDVWCKNLPGSNPIWYRPMDLEDCRRLLALGMEIQPHSHTHRPLGWLKPEEMEQEIQASKVFVEGILGQS